MSILGDTIGATAGAAIGGIVAGRQQRKNMDYSLALHNKNWNNTLKQQGQANEQAAGINYQYGERAAGNAFQREKEMNRITYEQNTYGNQVAQMKDAGLNVGLMYGGSGAGGGGAGSTGGGKQGGGASGGASPVKAPTPTEIAQLGLNMQMQKAQIANITADTAQKIIDAKKSSKQGENIDASTRKISEEGRAQWMENIIVGAKMEKGTNNSSISTVYGDRKGEYSSVMLNDSSPLVIQAVNDALNSEKDLIVKESVKNANDAVRALNNERADEIWAKLVIAQQNANTQEAEMYAKKLASEWNTGEFTNWKTWTELGMDASKSIMNAIVKKGGVKK